MCACASVRVCPAPGGASGSGVGPTAETGEPHPEGPRLPQLPGPLRRQQVLSVEQVLHTDRGQAQPCPRPPVCPALTQPAPPAGGPRSTHASGAAVRTPRPTPGPQGALTCAAGACLVAAEPHELLHLVLGNLQVLVAVAGLRAEGAEARGGPLCPPPLPQPHALCSSGSGQGVSLSERRTPLPAGPRGHHFWDSSLSAVVPNGPRAAFSSS